MPWRFSGGKADFTLGHGESRDGIHDEQNALASIAKKFRDGERDETRADTQGRGHIGSCDDDDAAVETFFAQVFLQEVAHFAIAFADERDDADVGGIAAGHRSEKGAFAYAGTAENADALALTERQKAINRSNAGNQRIGDVFAVEWTGRRAVQIVKSLGFNGRAAIHGLAEAVEHATEQ